MQQELAQVTGTDDGSGQQVKSAGNTTSAKKSTGQQADSLTNPNKSKTSDSITVGE
jgi:uncharacterized Zn-binding protein involved in type VI secretion